MSYITEHIKLMEQASAKLGKSKVRLHGRYTPQQVKKAEASYKKGLVFAAKKLYPIYKKQWGGRDAPGKFATAMTPTDIMFNRDASFEIFLTTKAFEGHEVVIRFDKNGTPKDAHI